MFMNIQGSTTTKTTTTTKNKIYKYSSDANTKKNPS